MPRMLALLSLLLVGCTAATRWNVVNGESSALRDGGRRVVRLAPIGGNHPGSNIALALVEGVAFGIGTIDVDLEGNGAEQASFLGVAFAVADGEHYEAVYFRPFNFRAADAGHRAHAVQYVAWTEQACEQL